MLDKILGELNPAQREAVLHTEGPLLILSGAGSGKTRVITHRIAYLIKGKGVPPFNILAVTFTNKAADEMKRRLEELIGLVARAVWMGTFHSICARILRKEIHRLGYSPNFSIYDESDQLGLMREIFRDLNISERSYSPRAILSAIERAKHELIDPEQYEKSATEYFEIFVSKLYREYQGRLRANNALDFGDLIMICVKLFEEFPEVLERYQERFRYILIDEYQDTNHAQYRLVNMLAAKYRNICAVGDDDQGIYSWRGADIRNILNFERDYPDAKVVKLEQNYRSTQRILDAAYYVISNNRYRKEKRLWTENELGDKIFVYEAEDEAEEGDFVAQEIKRLVREGIRPGEIAVFYRINAQSRTLEDAMRRANIPYKIVGGLRFYDRMEIKDILAYLRVLVNPSDTVSLRRIINVPPRRIGETTVRRLMAYAERNAMTLFEAMEAAAQGKVPEVGRAQKPIAEFVGLIKSIDRSARPTLIIQELLEKTGYINYLLQEGTPEAESRVENVRELLSATEEYEERVENPTLEGWLEEVSLITSVDEMGEEDKVALMTLHSAKGLEFDVVFITGMEEGLLPHQRSFDSEAELEEERRLCYVGITRARKRVYLTRACIRRLFGYEMYNIPSRFLDEIPDDLKHLLKPSEEAIMRIIAESVGSYRAEAEFDFKKGDLVRHPRWGVGVVTSTSGKGLDMRVTVRFEDGSERTLMVEYAKLEKIRA
ncbi:DNA helicase PcrA [Candidatus Poribacteria bacterium]|nr:MAG: DNA helicase PcrA [Candidatus Poribacteria bacterium]